MDNKILKAGIIFPAILIILQLNLFAGLLEDVRLLKIGVENYYIGEKLSNFNKFPKIKKSFKGTEKYKIKNLFVTVTKKEKIIIVMYKKFDNVSFDTFKRTLSFLMLKFGEPTVEAHNSTIYWFYSKHGKIDHNELLKQKKKGHIKKPILMVKFFSKEPFSEKNKKCSFYYIIYSEPLIHKFLK